MAARRGTKTEVVDLDLDAIEDSPVASLVFKFAGKNWHVKDPEDMPWTVVAAFYESRQKGDIGILLEMDDIFRVGLFDGESDEFLELKSKMDGPMSYKKFKALSLRIIQATFGGPTKRSSSSTTGSPTTAPTSEESSSSPASRSRRAG